MRGGLSKMYIAWIDGYIRVIDRSGLLLIEGSNFAVEIHQREIAFRGPYESLREYLLGQRGDRKVIYIDFAFKIKGFKGISGNAKILRNTSDFHVGPYGLGYTRIDSVEYYLSIYPPPGSLFDQLTITSDKIAIFTIGRRKVYLMEEGDFRKIIFV